MWRIEFESAMFLPFLPEEAQANPGAYGFELAAWLSQALAGRGVITTYPLGEDWGWLLEYFEGELEIVIGCSSVCGEGEGYKGAPITWSIFVDPRRSLKQKLKGVGTVEQAQTLATHITVLLGSKSIEWRLV
jgi:hypothetical protein